MYSSQLSNEHERESELHAQHANRDHTTPPSLADDYRFIKKIGHGSQGRIYLAKRLSDDQNVVIKQLNIDSIKTWKEYTLFKREGDVLATLHIDGVAKFYEYRECLEDMPPCAYIVQEYIQGETIQTMLNRSQRFEIHEVYDIVLQILNILELLQSHDPPIIHRDIKPSNIILSPKVGGYKAHLIDFGAVANPQLQGGGSTVAGTYGYMAPEQLMGTPVPASDIYSLGALIVYLLSGVSPADMQTKDFRLMFEPELQSLNPSVVQILRQMLEPDTKKRLSDITKLKDAFYHFSIGQFDLNAPKSSGLIDAHDNEIYTNKLCAVSSYGDAGNIELWSELPDELPRQVPSCYDLTFLNPNNDNGEIDVVQNFSHAGSKLKLSTYLISNFFRFIIACITHPDQLFFILLFTIFTSIMPFSLPIYLTILRKDTSIAIKPATFDILIWIRVVLYVTFASLFMSFALPYVTFTLWLCLVLFSFFVYTYTRTKDLSNPLFGGDNYFKSLTGGQISKEQLKAVEHQMYQIRERTQRDNKIFSSIMKQLIINGRKTVARIVSIEYINSDNELVTAPSMDDYMLYPKQCLPPIFHGTPTFRISYIFNPPDDVRSEDLKHSFKIHTDPETYLKVGDPLPILYMIEQKNVTERVTSMPFPLVLNNIISLNLKEVIDSSTAPLLTDDK